MTDETQTALDDALNKCYPREPTPTAKPSREPERGHFLSNGAIIGLAVGGCVIFAAAVAAIVSALRNRASNAGERRPLVESESGARGYVA
jgi:hypothetical protein